MKGIADLGEVSETIPRFRIFNLASGTNPNWPPINMQGTISRLEPFGRLKPQN